jgi:hypothetical protein
MPFLKDKTALVISSESGIARATPDDIEPGVLFTLTNSYTDQTLHIDGGEPLT